MDKDPLDEPVLLSLDYIKLLCKMVSYGVLNQETRNSNQYPRGQINENS